MKMITTIQYLTILKNKNKQKQKQTNHVQNKTN